VRELDGGRARLADLRAAIPRGAAGPERDQRYSDLGRALVAAGHVRLDKRPASTLHPLAPPMARSHARSAPAAAARPLTRKSGTLHAARDLMMKRRAELGAWLEGFTGGGERVRLSELPLGGEEVPRRWVDVARAAHLGGGRALRTTGFALEETDGDVVLGDEVRGLTAPDGWITRRR
jgi:hypothetical protein